MGMPVSYDPALDDLTAPEMPRCRDLALREINQFDELLQEVNDFGRRSQSFGVMLHTLDRTCCFSRITHRSRQHGITEAQWLLWEIGHLC